MMAAEDRMEQVEKEYPARASEAPLMMMPRGKDVRPGMLPTIH